MFHKAVKLVRYILNIPLFLLISVGSIYSYLLKLFDRRNHDTYWEENLQKQINKKISKKIFINKKKFLKFYTPTSISAYEQNFFYKEPDTLKWLDKNGGKKKFFMILEQMLDCILYTIQKSTILTVMYLNHHFQI